MITPSKTTELEAVNVMLDILGNSPVNTLNPPYGVDVAKAKNLLYEASKDVQGEGWAFNTETEYTLVRDASNHIPVPENMISVDADQDPSVDVVERAGELYDRKARTNVFAADVKCEVMWMFPFDELPECARRYIMIVAARRLQARELGSDTLHQFTALDETRARVRLMHEEATTSDINILNGPAQAYISRRGDRRRYS